MKVEKEISEGNPLYKDNRSPKTEKAVYWTLEKRGFTENEQFEKQKPIFNIPFCKSNKHKVDLILKNSKGEKLYVEIKGEMTYLEVNKLRYLLDHTPYNFYILQLTEIDWIKPFERSKFKRKILKSKDDFETQIDELIGFVEGTFSAEQLTKSSRKRLMSYIKYRGKDLKRWRESQ